VAAAEKSINHGKNDDKNKSYELPFKISLGGTEEPNRP